jgi:UDP-N-acetylglucosamine 2-epimerase
MKVLTIVGARPQFIKTAALSRALRKEHEEVLVHTGQHYDYELSGVFFDGLELPAPDVHLEVGSGPHGWQTARMLEGIEQVIREQRPRWLLVYGDTNSTLAGALAAAKLHVPVAHVEAGLRSFNRQMPEEINRVVADHVSDLLFCPSEPAVRNLAAEGITRGVHVVGDVMQDVLNWARTRAETKRSATLEKYGVEPGKYLLVTVHRSENTDNPDRLSAIVGTLNRLQEPLLFPIHPRSRKMLAAGNHELMPHVRVIDPVGYLEIVLLSASARMILTDSGGLQKEAYWLGVPCVTLREETEWIETAQTGWNMVVGADEQRILRAVKDFAPPSRRPALYGNGDAAERCVELLGA